MTDIWKTPPEQGKMWIDIRGAGGFHTYEQREIDQDQLRKRQKVPIPKLNDGELLSVVFRDGRPPVITKRYNPND